MAKNTRAKGVNRSAKQAQALALKKRELAKERRRSYRLVAESAELERYRAMEREFPELFKKMRELAEYENAAADDANVADMRREYNEQNGDPR
jgi:hypothetical protein